MFFWILVLQDFGVTLYNVLFKVKLYFYKYHLNLSNIPRSIVSQPQQPSVKQNEFRDSTWHTIYSNSIHNNICFTIHIRFSKFVVLSWKSYTLPHGWSEMFQVTGKSQVIDRAYKKIIHPPKSTFLPQRGCSLYTISIHKEWRIGKAKRLPL